MLREADRLLTIGEVALRLRQAPSTVRRKISQGAIPAVKIGDGPRAPIRIPVSEFELWLYGDGRQHPEVEADASGRPPHNGEEEEGDRAA